MIYSIISFYALGVKRGAILDRRNAAWRGCRGVKFRQFVSFVYSEGGRCILWIFIVGYAARVWRTVCHRGKQRGISTRTARRLRWSILVRWWSECKQLGCTKHCSTCLGFWSRLDDIIRYDCRKRISHNLCRTTGPQRYCIWSMWTANMLEYPLDPSFLWGLRFAGCVNYYFGPLADYWGVLLRKFFHRPWGQLFIRSLLGMGHFCYYFEL